ncbi:MAG: hypothetical protein LIP11_10675 [Clostridiales bacterium]|nr:hypothetical protein [Clostridiales bacterium]
MRSKKIVGIAVLIVALLTGCGAADNTAETENTTTEAITTESVSTEAVTTEDDTQENVDVQTDADETTGVADEEMSDTDAAEITETNSEEAADTEIQTDDADGAEIMEADAEETSDTDESELPHIYLRLGETEDRPEYEIVLENNEVSVRFIRILQDMTRVIPLYVFDGSDNTDVLQYYDIPSSYDVPEGTPELVTSEKAGEVYYSSGRIMIFYKDAEIEGYYVKIGETVTTEGLEDAVNSNPLDDWGYKRVTIGIIE